MKMEKKVEGGWRENVERGEHKKCTPTHAHALVFLLLVILLCFCVLYGMECAG